MTYRRGHVTSRDRPSKPASVTMISMQRGNPNWGKIETVPWRFCVRGKNPDGKMVTLGCYRTKEEATIHYDKLAEEGYYSQLKVKPF